MVTVNAASLAFTVNFGASSAKHGSRCGHCTSQTCTIINVTACYHARSRAVIHTNSSPWQRKSYRPSRFQTGRASKASGLPFRRGRRRHNPPGEQIPFNNPARVCVGRRKRCRCPHTCETLDAALTGAWPLS